MGRLSAESVEERRAALRAEYHHEVDNLSAEGRTKLFDELCAWGQAFESQLAILDQENGNLWKRMMKARELIQPFVSSSA